MIAFDRGVTERVAEQRARAAAGDRRNRPANAPDRVSRSRTPSSIFLSLSNLHEFSFCGLLIKVIAFVLSVYSELMTIDF